MQENTKQVIVKMTARRAFRTEPIWQYDTGHELVFEGFDGLPATFQVHFSLSPMGQSITQVGQNGVCTVPDMYTRTAATIYAWLYIAETDTGLTKYSIEIPVQRRAAITNQQPTPVEESAIDQAIAALNAAVTQTGEDVTAAGASAAAAARSASDANDSATAASRSATAAYNSAVDANSSREYADQSASNAGISERNAAASARDAATAQGKAEDAQAAAEAAVASYDAMTATATTLQPGSSATAEIDRTGDHPVLQLGLPQGATGATPDFSIGTVSTLQPGQDATATITGTAAAPVLNLGIPQGNPGDATIDDTAGAGDTTKVWSADKSAGEVGELKSALKQDIKNSSESYNVYSSSSFWQSGYISPTTGANAGSTSAIRLKQDYFFEPSKGVSYLAVNDGYVFYLYAYELDGTYVGSWDGANFVKAWSYKPLSEFVIAGYPQYKFRVALFADDQSIEVTDCSNFIALCDSNQLYDDNFVTNLFAYSTCDKGYVNADGSFHAQTNAKELTSDYIPVTAGDKYSITGYRFKVGYSPNILISYYNSEKVFQTRLSEWVTVDAKTIKLTIPDNISYMRVSVQTANGACQIINSETDVLVRYKYSVQDQVYNAETFSEIKTDISEAKNQNTTVADDLLKRTTEYADLFTSNEYISNNGYSVGGSANYKRSKLIKLNKDETVSFKLNGANTTSVFSVFSTNEMSQSTLLYNVVGRGTNVTIEESYTASVDVYVVFCYYASNTYMKKGLLYVKFSDSLIPIITELTNHNYFKNNNVISVNHRGWTNGAPENTIPSFALSKLQGFEWVETDVRYTSDNVPVLLHDATIDRTSNGTGNVDSFTLAQLKELDFGSWYSADYAGTKIPTFDEFVLFCKRAGLKIYIELKVTPIAPLVSIVKKYHMQDNVKWISYSNSMLADVKTLLPSAKLGYIVSGGFDANVVAVANGLKTDTNAVSVETTDYSAVTDAMITMLIENDLEFEIYTGSANASYECNQYVSAITSDGFIGGEVMADNVLRQYMD